MENGITKLNEPLQLIGNWPHMGNKWDMAYLILHSHSGAKHRRCIVAPTPFTNLVTTNTNTLLRRPFDREKMIAG